MLFFQSNQNNLRHSRLLEMLAIFTGQYYVLTGFDLTLNVIVILCIILPDKEQQNVTIFKRGNAGQQEARKFVTLMITCTVDKRFRKIYDQRRCSVSKLRPGVTYCIHPVTGVGPHGVYNVMQWVPHGVYHGHVYF